MRNRSSVILIKDKKVLLIERKRDDKIYYVFLGGINKGETPEEAAKREALEEIGTEVEIKECLTKIEFEGNQFYYTAEILAGKVGSGRGDVFCNREVHSFATKSTQCCHPIVSI
ncbi:NUDIX domain-containing protein [Atopococcus tabaci]|uniref:NUDIX domain-containing protein n=1 Tax=Atopococcus tabaci TaxID=269774 RepID=UPI00040A5735|nr:NUDIX domain-containing protein [Atopococcus tabaci]